MTSGMVVFLLIACSPAPAVTDTVTERSTTLAAPAGTSLPPTPEPAPTIARIPPALPGMYQSTLLHPLDVPRTYIQDTCQYLRNKWNPFSAQPGTVVMIIMLQSIYKGPVEETGGIFVGDLNIFMDELKRQSFVAINTKQLLAFMERNVYIPQRSVLIIQDSRRQADNFNKHFRGFWENWGWPVVNGFPSQPDTPESLWLENAQLENEGWVDHQAQGVMIGGSMNDDTSKAILTRELQGPKDAFAQYFHKNPIAIIWPGGGFGLRPVQAARELGYQLGFTTNSRGPVMYNWVPQADALDPERPAYAPEAAIGDPLMTLPRYWPSQVLQSIDKVRIMGNEAAEWAQANKEIELEYYDIVCVPTHGPIPEP